MVFKKEFPNVKKIFNLNQAAQICQELIFEEYEERKKSNSPLLCSECPGWICYAEKTLTTAITDCMSEIKSPQQIMGSLLRKVYGNNYLIVSVMPCYDKKL